jgi:hypothetical protein
MPIDTNHTTCDRLLARRERLARAAAAALAHGHEDGPTLEQCQYDLEESLEDRLPVSTWRHLWPTWRELDLVLAHEPATGQRSDECVLCVEGDGGATKRLRSSLASQQVQPGSTDWPRLSVSA